MKTDHLLIIRFSAMGDVAMTVPVVKSLAQQYPDLRITVLSKPFARTLFDGLAPNVSFMGADIKGEYHGIKGLNALYRRLTAKNFTAIADLHSILRSSYLRMRFNFDRYRVAHIDKHRAMRRALTATNNKQLVQLPTPFEGYADVLAQLGYPVNINFTSIFPPEGGDLKLIAPFINGKSKGEEEKKLSEREKAIREETACEGAETKALSEGAEGKREEEKVLSEKEEEEVKAESLKPRGEKWIGIAPFAAHKGKIYPLEKMERVIELLLEREPNCRIFLFGGGAEERELLTQWESRHDRCTCALLGSLYNELVLMSHLDTMVSMDSANMHLASLTGTRVVSVWGATHPFAGFMGWNQSPADAVQTTLPCRPCSIFGNKPCLHGDYPCLNSITPEEIVERVLKR
ncbi:MAG: glycosyltransferase family 9 protein [Prevotella sp.]|nr:glycosyltransferase family 9 protein [Prevotella sp.]